MPYYTKHVFVCTNQRDPGKECCANGDAAELLAYAKQKLKSLPLPADLLGKVRINSSGCIDRCNLGPVLVIYPEGTWYHYKTKSDIDEILTEHVLNGRIVDRLKLEN
jgi:(2Fe-2S) ferredoxin